MWLPRWITLFALLLFGSLRTAGEEFTRRSETVLTRDGQPLATDVYLPAGDGPFPTVLLRTPYNKEGATGFARDGASRGYAVVAQDTRGRFASGGENLPFHRDVVDGEDTIRWLSRQPWCNQRIGTWGGSAGAITQFQLVRSGVRPLAAQFLIVGAPDLHQVVYTGGVFRKSLIEDWLAATKFATNALSIWEQHPTVDDYWRQRDASQAYRGIEAAAVHLGGWWDIFAQPTIDGFVGYQNQGAKNVRNRQRLIMGPWTHGVLQGKAGEIEFPNAKNPPGDVEDPWRWFDRWLRDHDNGVEADPAVTYYVIGDVTDPSAPGNVWRNATTWPPFRVSPIPIFLHSDHRLSTQRPDHQEPLTYTYDPAAPVPTLGGIQLTIPAGPMDQRAIENRADVLVFSTEPLAEPLEVTGRIHARLWIASDAPDTDFFVRLCDVYPDGRSINLCEGMLRTRFRKGFHQEVFLAAGRPTPIEVDLWSTSVVFNRGHRMRVHVTSSSSPGFDPNPNTGSAFRATPDIRKAVQSLFVDSNHPSHLLLPVIGNVDGLGRTRRVNHLSTGTIRTR